MSVRILSAVASGLVLAVAFPSLDQAWLAWIGFVPLLLAMYGVGPRRAALLGWICGFVWQVATIYWIPATISNFTSVPPLAAQAILVLLAAFSAYPFVIFAASSEWARLAGLSRVAMLPFVWVVAEWLRVVVIAGFPWNPLGNTQIEYITIAQAADIGGVYLLSAAIVCTNVSIADALRQWRERTLVDASHVHASLVNARILRALAVAVTCPLMLVGYGLWRLDRLAEIPYTGSLRVGVVQGNIAQNEKWNARLRDQILEKYLELTNQAASAGAQLVVWPEAALPFYLQRDMRSLELTRTARERGIDMLIGAPGIAENPGGRPTPYNQAWLVRDTGEVEGPYNKIQLVPFGEYIPFYGLFGMVKVAVESVGQLGMGTEYTIFETVELGPVDSGASAATTDRAQPAGRRARFATLICYEGIFPSLTRDFAARGADFLVNISNDAWYGDTSAPHQHLAMAAMRTIENRLPMVRSTNTGISAFITDEGRVGATTPLFHEDMVVETVLVRDVWSFYRAYGDVFLHLCQALVVLFLLGAWRRTRRAVGSP